MKGTWIFFLVAIFGLIVAAMWNSIPLIKDSVHAVLNPTAGALLDWNVSIGMIIVSAIITLIVTLIQKYTTDQETLRQLKKEQKLLQEEMKKFKEHPEKLMELQKKQFALIPKTWDITMRALLFTAIPIVLFFRWFGDYFIANPVKIFGFMSWFWAYLVLSIIFSIIFRKSFNVA